MIRVLHVSNQFSDGGAARAAKRLCDAQLGIGLEVSGMASLPGVPDEYEFPIHTVGNLQSRVSSKVEEGLLALTGLKDGNTRNLGLLPSAVPRRVNKLALDVVNLHWVGRSTLAGWQLSNFDFPVVWTLHDLWAASGALHYPTSANGRFDAEAASFFASQYTRRSLFIERTLMTLKTHSLENVTFVAPTEWLAQELASRINLEMLDIRQVPIPIPTNVFAPSPKIEARSRFNLPEDRPLVGFAAATGDSYAVKGAYLLPQIGAVIHQQVPEAVMVAITANAHQPSDVFDHRPRIDMVNLAPIGNDRELASYYSALDVLVVPSLIDNFNQVAAEALACGTPVVAFDNSGLTTVIDDGSTGFLAAAFDPSDLGDKAAWLLRNDSVRWSMAQAARARALNEWSYETVANQYEDVYRSVLLS